MLDNLIQESLEKYKKDNILENKTELIEKITQIDKEYTKKYLEEIKKHISKANDLEEEQIRIKNIINAMTEREKYREQLNNIISEQSLEINLDSIPNIEKKNSFSTKLKIIETILNITSKLNATNKEKAIEILNRKEFKMVLVEFSIISNDSREEIERYINSFIKPSINSNKNDKLKILDYYQENKKNFPNLNIPNMGLIEETTEIKLDNNSFFIN